MRSSRRAETRDPDGCPTLIERLHNSFQTLSLTGRFIGRFKDGVPAVFFFGKGTRDYEGQRMRGHVNREMNADGFNMFRRIVEPRSRHHD